LNNENISYEILLEFLIENKINEHFASYILKSAKQNIFGLGHEESKNDYINLSLNDFIMKNKHLGSFDLRDEIHNFIRLSVYQQRDIDIASISLFWTKYYNRKDYSLINVENALKTFENKHFIKPEGSIKLIQSIQAISEKGYRDLLDKYQNNDKKSISKNSFLKSEEHFNQGILSIEDKDFILSKKVKCYEVAGFADGWYSVLADLEIYKLFERKSVVENIQKILYNAILGKVRSINSYCSLYHLPGNIPKLIADYDINIELDKLFNSFMCYIDMSLFDLRYNDDKMNKIESTQHRI